MAVPMNRIPMKRVLAAFLVLCILTLTTVYAEVTQDDIDAAKDELDKLEDQKDNAENAAENYAGEREKLNGDLNSLNGQLQSIAASMNELEGKIANKEFEIAAATDSLAAAELKSADQYENMKRRIQFMYENGNTSLLVALFESGSISEFLNRAAYISDINQYDREKLEEFETLQREIAENKQKLEADRNELLALRTDMEDKQNTVNSLIQATRANLSNAEANLAGALGNIEDIEEKIRKMEEYERQLEEQKAKEDAARLAAIKEQEAEDTSGVIYIPEESDLYLLGAIIQCEAEGEPYEGKLAVGSVVLNRVKSSYFPNTISGVIYQSGQFSPVASGRYEYRLQAGVNEECMRAAQEVLDGNITLNCLFFRTNNGIITGIVIGNHVFY